MANTNDKYIEILSKHGIRPTSVRILVLKAISNYHDTFSLSDLEADLESVDKSSIFRALILFAEHHVVHVMEDGSGSTKTTMIVPWRSCTAISIAKNVIRLIVWKTFIYL